MRALTDGGEPPSRVTSADLGALGRSASTAIEVQRGLTGLTDADLSSASRSDDPVMVAAAVVEAFRREIDSPLHEVQLLAGLAMCDGYSVQMRTGEGKTFAAAIPAAWHTARGQRVHIATANPYLASRDAGWAGHVLRRLGRTVDVLESGAARARRRSAYKAGVVYGSAADFGFDYLLDNLCRIGDDPVQRALEVAIIDEADAILLDQARVPLVISAPAAIAVRQVLDAHRACSALDLGVDFDIDPALQRIELTDSGVARCEGVLRVPNIYASEGPDWPHLIRNALRARVLLERNLHYIVRDESIEVIDETTGRVAVGRRWSDGLHQAVEAKEGLPLTVDQQPVGRTTFAGYFARYDTFVGMSGTFDRCTPELERSLKMRILEVPTRLPSARVDHPDAEFADRTAKLEHVAADIAMRQQAGQPVLAGTTSIADAHDLSSVLVRHQVTHDVLTAADDAREAAIVADAGRRGAVTVATQMAGRGVDIRLGGQNLAEHEGVKALGGLMVWGVDHHPAERLDNQLRGRAGRQGDPGETRFAVAPEDDLLALFGREPSQDLHGAAVAAQRAAESTDRTARMESRLLDGIIDDISQQLYEWRGRVARNGARPELEEALNDAVAGIRTGQLEIEGVRGARRKTIATSIEAKLHARESELTPDAFDEAATLTLRELLVVSWQDALANLDHARELNRILPQARQDPVQAWRGTANKIYKQFTSGARREWLRHLLFASIRIVGIDAVPPWPPTSQPDSGWAVAHEPTESRRPAEWSLTAGLRRRFGAVPAPTLTLELDAIGEPSAGRSSVSLDLDDPKRSVVVLSPAP